MYKRMKCLKLSFSKKIHIPIKNKTVKLLFYLNSFFKRSEYVEENLKFYHVELVEEKVKDLN